METLPLDEYDKKVLGQILSRKVLTGISLSILWTVIWLFGTLSLTAHRILIFTCAELVLAVLVFFLISPALADLRRNKKLVEKGTVEAITHDNVYGWYSNPLVDHKNRLKLETYQILVNGKKHEIEEAFNRKVKEGDEVHIHINPRTKTIIRIVLSH